MLAFIAIEMKKKEEKISSHHHPSIRFGVTYADQRCHYATIFAVQNNRISQLDFMKFRF